jgi:hypothetical protein
VRKRYLCDGEYTRMNLDSSPRTSDSHGRVTFYLRIEYEQSYSVKRNESEKERSKQVSEHTNFKNESPTLANYTSLMRSFRVHPYHLYKLYVHRFALDSFVPSLLSETCMPEVYRETCVDLVPHTTPIPTRENEYRCHLPADKIP